MPTLSFTFTADHGTRLTNALCGLHNYQSTILNEHGQNIPNPETASAFGKRMLKEWAIAQVRRWEEMQAKATAITSITPISID